MLWVTGRILNQPSYEIILHSTTSHTQHIQGPGSWLKCENAQKYWFILWSIFLAILLIIYLKHHIFHVQFHTNCPRIEMRAKTKFTLKMIIYLSPLKLLLAFSRVKDARLVQHFDPKYDYMNALSADKNQGQIPVQ